MVDFPPFFNKGDNFCDFQIAFLHTMPLMKREKKCILKGKNLLPGSANSFHSE